jgi:hypothetical protein
VDKYPAIIPSTPFYSSNFALSFTFRQRVVKNEIGGRRNDEKGGKRANEKTRRRADEATRASGREGVGGNGGRCGGERGWIADRSKIGMQGTSGKRAELKR